MIRLTFFLFELFPFWRTKWFLFNARAKERTNNLSIIFLKTEVTVIVNRKLTSLTTLKFYTV